MKARGLGHSGGLGERSRKHTPGRRRAHRPLLAAAAGALLAAAQPVRAPAQSPADRASLEQFREALAGVTDTASLDASLRVQPAASDTVSLALARLRRGFVELRLAELGNARRYDRADAAFREATRLEPEWPWPYLGRALAKYGIAEVRRAEPLELGTQVGYGALDDAVKALTDALARDPGFEPALAALGRISERFTRPDFWQRSLAAVRSADAAARANPDVLLALGRMERAAGSPDSAAAAFEAYLARGGRHGLGLLELARTRLAHHLPGGDSAYYAGAADDDTLSVRGYRNDIAVMLADSQLAGFDSARGEGRAEFLRRFWSDRDRLELRSPGERLPEHYRRLDYARKNFGLTVNRRFYPIGCVYRSGSMDFDDRGIIYIRQGEPTVRLRTYLFQIMPNESWRYDRADGNLLFHFGAPGVPDDYRLFSSVLELFGACRPDTRDLTETLAVTASDMYLSRQTLSPMYAKLGLWTGTIAGGRLAQEEA
ncbi:MAG: GWxTD domain-containing protein, partial [Bacillota bacterium]